ncbi:MAG: transcriptional repressor [Planctomycetota bacterium]|nr:transcriptional repressor [Planctomycetota bacterium]
MERNTKQRQAIADVLAAAAGPLSPREVLDRASKQITGLGMATVYRALAAMVEAGQVITVDVPGQPARYEPAGKGHHHHFHCTSCERLFEVEGCPGDLSSLAPPGFTVVGHDLTLIGVCKACSSKRSRANG